MRIVGSDYFAPILVALGLVGAATCFFIEANSFKDAVREWAIRDLEPRTELAASTLEYPLATGDFKKVRDFGDECSRNGVRFTVFSAPGGLVFDSALVEEEFPDAIYVLRSCGEYQVRLGMPLERVMAPFRKARIGFFLAALIGGAGVLLVFLFTYRQRMRMQEMRKVEKFRSEFIADVSHEIKTPLTGILGAVDLLMDGVNLPDDGRSRLLGMIRKESTRLNGLVQGVLSLARLEHGRDMMVDMRALDLSEIIRESVERMQPLAKGNGVTIRAEGTETIAKVKCDPQLIGQAIVNLLSNAIRHSGSNEVIVSISVQGSSVKLSVEDHGVGIPEEHRDLVFERFHRVDAARSCDTGGSGLGLAIVKRIVHLHCGSVALHQVFPSGCRFDIILPLIG